MSQNNNLQYFYIIRHIESGKMYAGSRYAKKCNPNEFMKKDGYTTSSNIINSIIEKESLDSFEILRIDTYCDGLHPYDYETLFLETNDCAKSEDWFNYHNNDKSPSIGSEEFKKLIMDKYGVEHIMHIPEIVEKVSKGVSKTRIEMGLAKGENNPLYDKKGADHPASFKRTEETKKLMSEKCGRWERTEEQNLKNSERQKLNSNFTKNNPMNHPEKRELVSVSKRGRKKFINVETGEIKMYLPGTEPEGFILSSNKKK